MTRSIRCCEVITWNPGCEIRPSSLCGRYHDSASNEALLQRLLYWGLQPMLPVDQSDHSITRWQAEHGGDLGVFLACAEWILDLSSTSLEAM